MTALELFGTRCLEVLADEWNVAVLACLSDGPASPTELHSCLAGLGYRVALARLRILRAHRLVEAVEDGGVSGRHRLTASGQAILDVIEVAAACERAWPGRRSAYATPGAGALAVAADPPSRAIARALAHERRRTCELEALLPDVSHATLVRRLEERTARGLLRCEREGRAVRYSLADAARRLSIVILHAGRWEGRFGDRDPRLLASDLASLIHQIAPLARVPAAVSGVFLLRERWHTARQTDVYVSVRDGRLAAFVVGPLGEEDATVTGTPGAWSRALVDGDQTALDVHGDRTRVAAVVATLHDAMRL